MSDTENQIDAFRKSSKHQRMGCLVATLSVVHDSYKEAVTQQEKNFCNMITTRINGMLDLLKNNKEEELMRLYVELVEFFKQIQG